jgi:adenine specific DNA methylase Mod
MVKLLWNDKLKNKQNNFRKQYKNSFSRIETLSSSIREAQEISKNKWVNQLFWGDNLKVAYHLLNFFKEKIDLIYIDPPFFSGVNYKIKINDKKKEYYAIAYQDKWQNDLDSYLQMIYERLLVFKKLLAKTGLLFLHVDWHASHYIRVILDEVFGQNNFINNIIWYYYNKYSAGKYNLPRAHDDILVYSKTSDYTLNELRIPRDKPRKQLKREMVNGVLKNAKDEDGHVIYRIVKDKKLDDVWKIPCMQPASRYWTGFPTQKHHKLLERIIKLGSNEGDLVADFFCGSGTCLIAAEKLNRKWIGCDNSKYSIYLTRKRIIDFQKSNQDNSLKLYPFEFYTILNEKSRIKIDSGFFERDLTIKRK